MITLLNCAWTLPSKFFDTIWAYGSDQEGVPVLLPGFATKWEHSCTKSQLAKTKSNTRYSTQHTNDNGGTLNFELTTDTTIAYHLRWAMGHLSWVFLSYGRPNGAAIDVVAVLVPSHVVKSLQLICRSVTHRWNPSVSDLQMSRSDWS